MSCMCGGRFDFLDHQTEHFIKHTDEACCHLCQMNFSHRNSLALHLKHAHPKYHVFCKSCNIYVEQQEQTVVTDMTLVTPKKEPLDEEVEEVIIENEEMEIKYVKEEEEEFVVGRMEEANESGIFVKEEEEVVVFGRMEETKENSVFVKEEVVVVGRGEETKENSITETPEDKIFNSILQDHSYFSTQMCSSLRKTPNNVVMYTSNENVLVFINKADTRISPEDSYTERDEQGSLVDDQTVCGAVHDHSYFSTQSLTNPIALAKEVSAHNMCSFFCKTVNNVINSSTENLHMFNKKAETRISPKDPDNTESDQWKHDHTYVLTQNCANCEFEPIEEVDVVGEYEESIQRSNNEDSDFLPIDDLVYISQDDLFSDAMNNDSSSKDDLVDTFQDDLSDTISCISTDSSSDSLEEGYQKQICENTNQKSLGSVVSVNSNPTNSLYQDAEFCTSCGLSKVSSTKTSMERCTCTPFTCPLCGIVVGTEETLLNHQAEKHSLVRFKCVRCMQLFPNQNIFMQHVCSKSKGSSGESIILSKSSNNAKEPLLTMLNFVPSPAAAESSKPPLSSQMVNIVNTVLNLGTVSNSTACLLPKSPSTCSTQKVPVKVMTTRSSGCAQKKNGTCLVLNGNQGQVTTPISTVLPKQIRQVQALSPLQARVVTPTSCSTTSSTQILFLSSQSQGQVTPISTVPQKKCVQMQDLTPLQTKVMTHTPTGSAELTSSIVLPQQRQKQPSCVVHLPPPILSQVSSSVSTSQTGQQHGSSVPFLDFCRSSLSTKILPSLQEPLKIVAMFMNQSKELALQKRMHQSWRSKAVIPCRQCGAVSRQFSLGVRHRYQHRGPRIHKCQCGRAFQQRMHLLRHQVQHAEATRYVCAACGQMFCGTQQLACHRRQFWVTASKRQKRANKECRNMFQCYCGHSFTRPAALLWHMLKNSKARKPHLKGFRLA